MISIIIPTYNERDNILPLVSSLENSLVGEHEIIFVDDNSPDGTSDRIRELEREYPCIRLVQREGKLGLSSAVVEGAKKATGDRLVVMDADLSHPPEKVPILASALDAADIAIGSRYLKGGSSKGLSYGRGAISSGAEALSRLILDVKCSDPMSGFFALKKDLFMKADIRTRGYKILLNIVYDNPGARVVDIPYVFSERHSGKTKLGIMEVLRYLQDIVRIRFR